jgi:aminoglycoside phosphotransferase (APT) family kinase protein
VPGSPMPAAEVEVDDVVVHRLVAGQFPHLAHMALRPARPDVAGWDNVLFRLGDDLVARLPRRAAAAELVAKEHQWLPQLAPRLPLPVPVPLYRGLPGPGYPWAWSICPWLTGAAATRAQAEVQDWAALATGLGEFLAALHQTAPPDAPLNPWRRGPLSARDQVTRQRLDAVRDVVDAQAALEAWEATLRLPDWHGPDVWAHGDLHPGNLLLDQGRLSAVVDFGDLTAGDPAIDLFSAWALLPSAARPLLRAAAGVDDATWARGRGWALTVALAILTSSADNPVLEAVGVRTIAELVAGTA